MSRNSIKRKMVEFSLPQETYELLTEKVKKMNYVNLKEYIVKNLLIDLLNKENNIDEIDKYNELTLEEKVIDLNKVNKDKRIYVRIDDKTFNILKQLSKKRGICVSTLIRNIIKDYLEINLKVKS
ncbi:MAG: ribbon-helix-helix domain-containing protein [Clostridia bacterium]|nr:ribbon-helix-helix domain-containing protein [Clostridia bacterium]